MTKEHIIDLARKAGLQPIYQKCAEAVGKFAYEDWGEELEAFAALVAAAEREECVKVCESLFDADDDSCNEAERCAQAIRARGAA